MMLGLGLSIHTLRSPGTVDPLEGIALDGRWQSHLGDDVPLRFYTDTLGTVPAVEWDPVASWRDANGALCTQGNPDKRPLLMFDENGHPYLDCDGSDDVLGVAPGVTAEASALTTFVLFVQNSAVPSSANASGVLDCWGNDAVSEDHLPWSSGLIYHGCGSTARKGGFTYSESITTPCVATFISGANDWRLYLNEALIHNTGTNDVGIGLAPKVGGNDGLLPGGGAAFNTLFFSGRVYAVLCMKRVATTEERETIVSYLAGLAQ
jgi:hypothetical protein